jgi:hypothetical protein
VTIGEITITATLRKLKYPARTLMNVKTQTARPSNTQDDSRRQLRHVCRMEEKRWLTDPV